MLIIYQCFGALLAVREELQEQQQRVFELSQELRASRELKDLRLESYTKLQQNPNITKNPNLSKSKTIVRNTPNM